jgi:GTP-binding protein
VVNGTINRNQQVAWCKADGTVERAKVGVIFMTDSHERREVESAGAGEIVAVAGLSEITIGETLADPENPVALPVLTVDEPSLSMTIGINTAPLNGQDGSKLTARQVKTRLDQELVGNVSIRVLPTDRPDAWEVQARGELQLAILIEMMRRDGFELTIGKPQVVIKEIDGVKHEPVERLSIDVPEEHLGAVTSLVAPRKGRLENMVNHGTGWVRMDYAVPARGLIGFRTEFMTETRGTGIMHHVFEKYEPWAGEMKSRERGSIVSDRKGPTTAYAITSIQERATLFVPPGTEVYEGMIVGENSRGEDMDVNICREKKLTNMRTSSSDHTVPLVPPRVLSLEQALEFIEQDECVEVTPNFVRLRKVELNATDRARITKALKNARG